MRLTVVGCGDAFGSGGRLQTCYHVATGGKRLLIDCGASVMIGMTRQGLDANAVGTILISHLHGDHFAGLVWWMLHAQHVAKRQTPLVVAGPPGIEARYVAASEALFPGSAGVQLRFSLSFREMNVGSTLSLDVGEVTPFKVSHPSGAPSHAMRFTSGGKTLAFTGDTEWVETLVPCGRDADLYIMECYALDGPVRYHTSWEKLQANLPRIGARKVMLTHMNASMLANLDKAAGDNIIHAEDGLVVEI